MIVGSNVQFYPLTSREGLEIKPVASDLIIHGRVTRPLCMDPFIIYASASVFPLRESSPPSLLPSKEAPLLPTAR